MRRLTAAATTLALATAGVLIASPASAAPTAMTGVVLEDVQAPASTSATTVGVPCDTGMATCGAPVTMEYGQGVQKRLVSFTVGAKTFRTLPVATGEGYTEVLRADNAAAQGARDSIFAARSTEATLFSQVVAANPDSRTMGEVLSSDLITEGSDNTFANIDGTNVNNVERISFMRTTALAATDPASVGLALVERGGNDPFNVAAVTAVDANGTPTAWGPVLSVPKTAWDGGTVLSGVPSTVMRRDVGEPHYRPTATTGAQDLKGVLIPLSDLGVASKQEIYGVSLISADQTTSPAGPFLTTTTEATGGLDLIGGVFSTSTLPTAQDVTGLAYQGSSGGFPLTAQAGDAVTPIVWGRTTFQVPSGAVLSEDGRTLTVPGEGRYVLRAAGNYVLFYGEKTFTGLTTPVVYTVYDSQGASASAIIRVDVIPIIPVAAPDVSTGAEGKAQSVEPLANDVPGEYGDRLDGKTLAYLDSTDSPVSSLTVPGQGTYTIANPVVNGNRVWQLVFTPLAGFVGAATPVRYRVLDGNGTVATSTYTPTVTPVMKAVADTSTGTQGAKQTVTPLANDVPSSASVPFETASLTLLDAEGEPTTSVVVADEGTYTIDGQLITFAPLPHFVGEAKPVTYRVSDAAGATASATYTPTVTRVAQPDWTTGLQGRVQVGDVLTNDGTPGQQVLPGLIMLLDASGRQTTVVSVRGVGYYQAGPGIPGIRFTPEPGFVGTAPPVRYLAATELGTMIGSTYTPTVVPVAFPDVSTGAQGVPQTVDPLANDGVPGTGVIADTLLLLDATGNAAVSVVVDGEGTYVITEGEIVFSPVPTFTGVATPVRYHVIDTAGSNLVSTYTATVTVVTPTAQPDTASGPQGVPLTVDVVDNDASGHAGVALDASTLTLLDTAGAPAATVIVAGQGTYSVVDGEIVFAPERTFVGTANAVTYRVADANGTTTTSTLTPTLTAVAPSSVADTSSGPQGVAQTVDVLANDAAGDAGVPLDPTTLTLLDAAGDPAAMVTIADQGVYSVVDGKLVFAPSTTFVGTATAVSYRVADANGTTTTSTLTPSTVRITPTSSPDTSTGIQGAPQSVDPLANDTVGDAAVPFDVTTLTLLDADDEPVASLEVAGQGTFSVVTGTLVFTPLPRYAGTPGAVSYRVADANGTTTTSTYAPTVTRVVVPDFTTGLQGAEQSVDPLADDGTDDVTLEAGTLTLLDADGVPATSVTVLGEGTFTIIDGEIVFTPERTFTGFGTVRYQVDDADGNTLESSYTVTVTAVTPAGKPDSSSGPQGVPQTVDVLGNDTPGDASVPLDASTLTLLDGAAAPVATLTVTGRGVYSVVDGELVFTPTTTYVGTATAVSYRVADENGTTTTATVTVSVTAVTPAAVADISSGTQGAPQSVNPIANDTVGHASVPFVASSLTLLDAAGTPVASIVVAGQGTYLVDAGALVFTPLPRFAGSPASVSYRVADANGTTTRSTYAPSVTRVALPDATAGLQGAKQSVDPLVNDGTDDVTLAGSTLTLLDADGTPTTTVTIPDEGTFTVTDGEIVFTPELTFAGSSTVRYQVDDADGNTVESDYTVTVGAVTPVATADTASGPQGLTLSVDVLDNDEPGDASVLLDAATLTLLDASDDPVATVTVAGQGTYTVVDGEIVFTPERTFVGTATAVTYRIADANGTTTTSTLTPTLTAVTPTSEADTSSGPQGVARTVDVLANDDAGNAGVPLDPTTLTLLGAAGDPVATVPVAGQGEFSVVDGEVFFAPTPTYVGAVGPVTYRVADANGTITTSTVTVTLTAVTPVAKADTSTGTQGAPQSVDPLANDTAGDVAVPLNAASLTLLDADADAAPVASVVVPGAGTYSVAAGTLVFTPLPGFVGAPAAATYRVADANGTTATATLSPTVTPVAVADATTGPQGVPQSVDPLVNDTGVELAAGTLTLLDPAGDPSETVTVAGEGRFALVDGAIVFTPERGFIGTASAVGYEVEDLAGNAIRSVYVPTLTAVVPVALPDVSSGSQGTVQSVRPFDNDMAGDPAVPFDTTSLTLIGADGRAVSSITIDGAGTYVVEPGRIVFTAVPGFVGSADAVTYQVVDVNGTTTGSTYTATVTTGVPVAVGTIAATGSGVVGSPVSIDPTKTIAGLVPGSVRLVDAAGEPVERLEVLGEGVWTVDTTTGIVTFTPEAGFTGDPRTVSVLGYTVDGTVVAGTLEVVYAHPVTTAPAAAPTEPLAITGSDVARTGVAALTLLLAGAFALLAARRRTPRRH